MHLLQTYALATGSKIKKPFILKKLYPLSCEKYITIQNSSGMTGKCYDYFQDVIDFLHEKLEKFRYKIVQIGNKDDKPLQRVINLQGLTDIHQTAFILNNSKLHIGNDSFAVHMCSAFDIPLVALYSISSPEIAGPFWKNNNQICLTPENWLPSFNPNESPKKVNEIKIEKVVSAVESLLFKDSNYNINILNIGNKYGMNMLECYADQILPPDIFPNQLLNIRLDYSETIENKEYNAILNNLNIRECSIVTDKPFNLQPFIQFKERLNSVFYDVTKELNIEFLNNLNILGVKTFLVFHLNEKNESELNSRKIDIIDYPLNIEIIKRNKINIESSSTYKSSKLLFANNKIYLSKTAKLNDKPILDLNSIWEQSLNDFEHLDVFAEDDCDYCLIYKNNI